MMVQERVTRRQFAKLGAALLGLGVLRPSAALAYDEPEPASVTCTIKGAANKEKLVISAFFANQTGQPAGLRHTSDDPMANVTSVALLIGEARWVLSDFSALIEGNRNRQLRSRRGPRWMTSPLPEGREILVAQQEVQWPEAILKELAGQEGRQAEVEVAIEASLMSMEIQGQGIFGKGNARTGEVEALSFTRRVQLVMPKVG